MNLLQKQGFFNSITLYLGVFLGFFNSIILFQRYLSLEEIGYFTLLIYISLIYTQISSLGFSSVITRYFPFYKTNDKGHGGFPSFVFLVVSVAFLTVTLGFFFFKEVIFSYYADKDGSSLMSRYYYYIIPVSFFTLVFLVQQTLALTAYKSVFPTFLREVMIKLFTTAGVLMIIFKWIDFKGFLNFYLMANIIIVLIISWYNHRIKLFKITSIGPEVKSNAGPMMSYGMSSMISGSAIAAITGFGIILLKMISGEAMVGIYGTLTGIAMVISLPAKALNTTSYQIIADAWKNEDLDRIAKIYYKTSIIQLLIGILLLLGLIINQRNIVFLLHKPEYADFFNVFILLGCAYLVDITGGLNQAIISFSKHYKIVVRTLIFGAILSVVLNYFLISRFGIAGAAWSYVLTMFFLNFVYWLYIKLKFRIQPFGKKHLFTLFIGGVCLLIGLNIPDLNNYYFDVILRSSIVTIIYVSLAYWLNISEDINELLDKVLKKQS
jgi:O-antigen/teichoic acid export membrane protein